MGLDVNYSQSSPKRSTYSIFPVLLFMISYNWQNVVFWSTGVKKADLLILQFATSQMIDTSACTNSEVNGKITTKTVN